jgi:hypothetical protein
MRDITSERFALENTSAFFLSHRLTQMGTDSLAAKNPGMHKGFSRFAPNGEREA